MPAVSPPFFSFLKGGDIVKRISAGIPNITGRTWNIFSESDGESGALSNPRANNNGGVQLVDTATKIRHVVLDASKSNALYGASTTVQPPALSLLAQIKY